MNFISIVRKIDFIYLYTLIIFLFYIITSRRSPKTYMVILIVSIQILLVKIYEVIQCIGG